MDKYQVTDIPRFTASQDSELNRLKHLNSVKRLGQEKKDRMDELEFLKGADKFRTSDPRRAVSYYERAIWEKETGFVEGLIYGVMKMFRKKNKERKKNSN